MKLIIEIPIDLLERTKSGDYNFGDDLARNEVIANGIPYDKVIDEVTELLENEWGYEGMRDDVSRIMRGGAEEENT